MPDELLRRLTCPAPVKGLVEGLDPASPLFPNDAAADLLNLRTTNGRWDVRRGFAAWKSIGGSGAVHYLARVYLSSGTAYTLAAQGGALYQQTGSGSFGAVAGGTGLSTAPQNGRYCGVTLKDYHYLTDRGGALKRWDVSSGLASVTQGTRPTVAPTTKRRSWGTLEAWAGTRTSAPTGWTGSDPTNFPLVIGEVAGQTNDDSVPDFPVSSTVSKLSVKTSGAKNETWKEDISAGESLNSHYICFWMQSDQKRALTVFEIGANAPKEFGVPLDPPEGDQPYLVVFPTGNLPTIKYKQFRCTRNASGSLKNVYLSKLILPGKLQGKYRYRYSFYNPTTGSETGMSPASEFVDCSEIPTAYKSTTTDCLEKCVELNLGAQSIPSVSSHTRVRWYRNGGLPELTKDGRGQDKWLRLATSGDINATLAGGSLINATSISVATGIGAANLSTGDWIVIDQGVVNTQEYAQVDAVTTGSPNDAIRIYTDSLSLTGLAIDAVTNSKVTASTYTFTSADVGKTLKITGGSGFTTGYYTISSVASGAATLSSAAGTLSSLGGTALLLTGLTKTHPLGATVKPAYVDNTANEAIDVTTSTLPERDDPPSGAHWLARAPDGRLWLFRTDKRLEVAVSNRPTVDHPLDHEVFPEDVDPLTRGSLLQGWRFYVDGDAHGDEIRWGGFFNGLPTIMTNRAIYQVHAYSQADWSPTAISKVYEGVGCLAGETVQEVNGKLYWVADGPRVMEWDGRSAPRDLSFQKLTHTLGNAPSAYWGYWFGVGRADQFGAAYDLFVTPAGGIQNTLVLSYNLLTEAWEPLTYYDESTELPWATALVQNGPGDLREYYAAHPTSGNVRQLETGSNDNGTAIPMRSWSKKFTLPEGWIFRGEKVWLYVAAPGPDTLTVRVRGGGSEYRSVSNFAATDGDPYQDAEFSLADTESSEGQYYARLNFYRLKGTHVQFQLSGNVSNRPPLDRLELDFSLVRKARLTG